MGNWSGAPHADLQSLLESKEKRWDFLSVLERNSLALAALNCSGNQLHPVDGERQSKVVYDTLRLAEMLDVHSIVLMSGLPAGGPADVRPNWITCAWPPEHAEILTGVERETGALLAKLAAAARDCGVTKLCIEMHDDELVYNVPTLLKLRKEIGQVVGANFDPSHLFWMGADPLAAIPVLGDAIHHVDAKDTMERRCAESDWLPGPSDTRTSKIAPGAISLWDTAMAQNGGVSSAIGCVSTAMTAGCPSSMRTSFFRA